MGTARPRAFYLCASQRVLVHKSLDKFLRPNVSQQFLQGKGEVESGNGKLWGGGACWGPSMVLPAHPRRVSGHLPFSLGSASLSWVVTELSTIPEGGSPSFPMPRGCLSS